jgi:hypothetical protein
MKDNGACRIFAAATLRFWPHHVSDGRACAEMHNRARQKHRRLRCIKH